MEISKLNEIVQKQNDRLEYEAVQEAGNIINEIVNLKKRIQGDNQRIAELQSELKALEIQSINAEEVLPKG